ncbi:MAG: penicillin-binding protein 2 [Rhodobacteraceae bacterium]|uniref:Peptidoglycan glycosyltransferase n=1 Tax=Salipiger profundus TaxID=1229727 RepID=A0A1U7D162_9RHOB|nr:MULTISPECIES: penicillin-binding protein 2 [Salipiger]APX21894.1 peptidoglycan glycosyltransferase [Salipiger profundus]MAB08076.1 penicillin-binding protein 2 [Paracoccaceae bacterium]GGA06059.1 peptidoglycan glycosyltransferase [Salipiger profundus]SFC36145.1 peptidoglycan glycosyltransferase [Salipiger profundus]
MRRTPRESADSTRKITRRGLMLGGAQLAFAGVLGLRMHHMQVDQADEFRLLAEENRVNIHLIPPSRGRIFDREGRVIADNEPTYRITMRREDAGDVEDVIRRLSALVELDEKEVARALEEMRTSPPFLQVTIADRVSWDAISRVAVNAPALPGVTPEVGLSRFYPQHQTFAHVVGYVGPVSDRDLARYEDPEPVLRIPRFQIGKVGIEAKFEDRLRGSAGAKRVEVNAVGRVMRELDRREGEAGADMQLTVDSELQDYIKARLGEESASAVVMDVENGDVLAIASSPSYDPNKFVRGISVKDYGELRENNHRPLASKTVQDAYPPGSTFKIVTVLAGLEAGIIGPDDTVYCPGYLEVGSRRFHCWKRAGHGHVNLERSLRDSCDVYYYDLAMKVGIEKIADMGRRLGLGAAPDVPMSAVTAGLMPDKEWKRRERGAEWLIGDTVNASIGQGFVLTSPLQQAIMVSRVATGRAVSPRLVRSIGGIESPSGAGAPLDIDPQHLRWVRKAMFSVSNSRRGTAYRSRIIADDMRMAGKTGTSQVLNRVVRNSDVPWEERDHALFVNFAPFEAPRVAVSIVVEHGGGGSSTAAPIARDITLQALYKGTPPLDAYPASDRGRIQAQQERLERERRARAEEEGRRA